MTAPGTFEDLIQKKHRHVTADAIALARDAENRFPCCLPKSRLESIQLQYIRPSREIRVTSTSTYGSSYLKVGCWVVPGVVGVPSNEVLRMFGDPRVIRRYVVRHEIEDQFHAPLGEFFTGNGEALRTCEMFVSDIASHAIRRSNVVFQSKVRQSSSEIIKQSDVSICDGDASRTSFPNPHQPHTIEAILSDGIPFG